MKGRYHALLVVSEEAAVAHNESAKRERSQEWSDGAHNEQARSTVKKKRETKPKEGHSSLAVGEELG